jgi:hypothetical protein
VAEYLVEFITGPPRNRPTRPITMYSPEVAWNVWHGSFTWLDDLAFDVLCLVHEEFSGPDLDEFRQELETHSFPITNFRTHSK